MAHLSVDPPPPWPCLEDRLAAFLETHPDYDTDDAIEALIWGKETDDAREYSATNV